MKRLLWRLWCWAIDICPDCEQTWDGPGKHWTGRCRVQMQTSDDTGRMIVGSFRARPLTPPVAAFSHVGDPEKWEPMGSIYCPDWAQPMVLRLLRLAETRRLQLGHLRKTDDGGEKPE